MTNLQVAKEYVFNALAYAEDVHHSPEFSLEVVKSNLKIIQKLLENPEETNQDHDWEDFK